MRKKIFWILSAFVLIGSAVLLLFFIKPDSRVYSKEDVAGIIMVGVGDLFVIVLDENPTTGFCWHFSVEPEGAIKFKSDQFIITQSKDMVGVPGLHEFIFEAVEPGSARLEFVYYRPWEPEEVEGSYRFHFIIR